jgi:PhnB protein
MDFYERAFGAEETYGRFLGPRGELIHTEIRIGDSILMLTQESADSGDGADSPETLGGATAIMATYWEDVDVAWARAIAAGAGVIYPLADHFYGERGGRVLDPFGHQWMMSQVIEELSRDELSRRAAELFGAE